MFIASVAYVHTYVRTCDRQSGSGFVIISLYVLFNTCVQAGDRITSSH